MKYRVIHMMKLLSMWVLCFFSFSVLEAKEWKRFRLDCGNEIYVDFPEAVWNKLDEPSQLALKSGLRSTGILQMNNALIVDAILDNAEPGAMTSFEVAGMEFKIPKSLFAGMNADTTAKVISSYQQGTRQMKSFLEKTLPAFAAAEHAVHSAVLELQEGKSNEMTAELGQTTVEKESGDDGAPKMHFLTRGEVYQELTYEVVGKHVAPPRDVAGMHNVSLNEDGSNASFCLDPADQCTFKEENTGISITGLTPGMEPSTPERMVQKNFSESSEYCSELNWGGYDDWRMPGLRETLFLERRLNAISEAFPYFGSSNVFLWTTGFPQVVVPGSEELDKHRVVNVATDDSRNLSLQMKSSFRCLRSEGELLWKDWSTKWGTRERVPCDRPGVQCAFKSNQVGPVIVSAPQTVYLQRGDERGIFYDEAVGYCAALNWNGLTGWRIPSYTEGRRIARAQFFGYALGRDGLLEAARGKFWVAPPYKDDYPIIEFNPSYQQIRFTVFRCDFAENKCERDYAVDGTGAYAAKSLSPRGEVICVHDTKG